MKRERERDVCVYIYIYIYPAWLGPILRIGAKARTGLHLCV